MNSVSVYSSLFGVVISTLIFKYVYDLENQGCLCSKDWKRTYIKYFSVLLIFLGVLSMSGFTNRVVIMKSGNMGLLLLALVSFIVSIGSLVYLYAIYMFSHNLIRHKDCPCSESHLRTFTYYYSILVILLYAFVLFVLFFGIFYAKSLILKGKSKLKL
jgi:hypothetical protein